MRLLQKTNRAYFLVSGTAFIIAGIIFYFVISFFFKDQLNEKLFHDINNIIMSINRNGPIPNYYPFIEIREVSAQSEQSYSTIDTLIFDTFKKKEIPFRQISLITFINGKEYFIAARDTLLEEDDLLEVIAIVTSLVFVLLLVGLYFINRKLSLRIWQPFYKTLNELKGFSHDRPDFRLSSESQLYEFTELNKTLEKLTRKVISDYQSLKRFTEDASHEIQTPLAVIQSKLETLMQYPELKKDQAELINTAYIYILRISKLTQTLLLLTKIANDQFPDKKTISITDLVGEKIKMFEDHILKKSLTLKKDITPDCFLETNFFLAESLVINLIGNAVKHNIKRGIIKIKLDKDHLEISNSGGTVPIPASKLFDRFFKADKSSDSPGLGLAIVKEICRLNNWEIKYSYDDNFHKFIVNF
jgi:two-component system, OmpR family, sensor kinase